MNKLIDESGDASQYVITLMSSTTPMSLLGPSARELAGLAVFRSQRREDGRDRFRLHIGFFASAEAAEEMLPHVRDSYPAAFVGVAPETNMGSLDDTAVARFSVIRPIEAEPPPPAMKVAPPPPAPAMKAAPPPPRKAAPPSPPRTQVKPSVRPAAAVHELVEIAAPRTQRPAPPPARKEPVPHEPAQHYAVQLLWSGKTIDVSKIPLLEIFDGYLLYAVETEQGGRRMYGVRLGFYGDALSAGLVARYVRPAFAKTVVVPVSDREQARASGAAIGLASLKAGRKSESRARWPASAIPVDFLPEKPGRMSATL